MLTPFQQELKKARRYKSRRTYILNVLNKPRFTELTSLHLPAYGVNGTIKPRPDLCCAVTTRMHGQCGSRRDRGPENAYCYLHNPTKGQEP